MGKKSKPEPKGVSLSREHFLNRELQALEFNRRVLAQADDRKVPLLERLKFLCIVSSNLDEFFEIRVSGLKEQIKMGAAAAGPDGMKPLEVFRQVAARAQGIVERQYRLLNEEILPALVRKIAWSGDARRGAVRIELGAGALTGATLLVAAEGGRVQVTLSARADVELEPWRERIIARLAARGLEADVT